MNSIIKFVAFVFGIFFTVVGFFACSMNTQPLASYTIAAGLLTFFVSYVTPEKSYKERQKELNN